MAAENAQTNEATPEQNEVPRKRNKTQFAIELATGVSIPHWAKANNVPRSTAHRWAKEPKVLTLVDTIRRGVIDQAVGLLSDHAAWAAQRMAYLADRAASESVQLRALRAILADLITLSKCSGLEARVAEVEEYIRARTGKPGLPN